jgi:hypothetical protein
MRRTSTRLPRCGSCGGISAASIQRGRVQPAGAAAIARYRSAGLYRTAREIGERVRLYRDGEGAGGL